MTASQAYSLLHSYNSYNYELSPVDEAIVATLDNLEERLAKLEPPLCECNEWLSGGGPYCSNCGSRLNNHDR